METQVTLRQAILAKRRSLRRDQVEAMSLRIQERLVLLPEFVRARTIALYRPFWNEVETGRVAQVGVSEKKRIVYPEIKAGGGMSFILVSDAAIEVPMDEIDLVVVPGVVFDELGHRIGLGKGYYDRALSHYKGTKVGLAYDLQVVAAIPVNSHDVACDVILTELRQLV